MTKFNRTRFKKAMAAILAVAMIGQNCSYVVSAEDVLNTDAAVQEQTVQETEQQTADIQPVEEAPQTENVEVPQTDSAASVTEVPAETPVEAQSTAVDNQSADTQVEKPEESTEAINNESSDADTETTQGEADSDADTENAQDNAQSQEEAPTAIWHVTFAGDAAAHGTIQVKGEAAPADVASYNKEVKENEKFEFSITAAQGFEVERVTLEANGAELGKNAEGFYEIPAVTKDERVLVTYRELPQEPVAEPEPPAAEEPKVEEPSEGVRENEVDFITDGGAAVIVDGVDVTNGSAMAKDGTIVYTIIPNNDYEIVSILIDNDPNLPARFNEATEEVNDYITEGISETTSVVITTKAIEPVEEEPAEEPNEEISPEKPAQKLTATAADGARITVNAPEGALPEGSAVVVEVIESKAIESALENALEPAGKELNSYKAYDITIIGPDGTAIQPDDSVKVSIRNAAVDGEENAVYHVDGASVDKIADISNGNNASFEAEHFSIYVITGENTPEIATYEFYDKDGTTMLNSQRVKDGEVLVEPAAPEYEGQYFTGWFVEGSATPLSFGPVSVSSSGIIKVVAGYEDAYYVFFKNDAGVVINTKTGKNGDIISTDDVTFPVLANEGITGWYTDSALTSKVTNVELNNSDVILYPKVEKGYHITYKSEGGSYTAPVFVPPATSTVAPTAPTRPGYKFKYWSVAQNGLEYQFGKELTADLTLHAVWEAMDTTYLVMYWQENANYNNGYLEEESKRDKEQYSYAASETKTGKTGAQTNVNSWKGLIIPEGFTLKNIEQQTIAGDGSTVVNVYLDRKTFTVKFMKKVGYGWNSTWEEDSSLRITAKYGADVSSKWPGGTWRVSENSSTRQANLFVMPNGGAAFYEYSAYGTNTAYYYVQTLPNESGEKTIGNTKYKLHHSDTAYGQYLSVTEEDRYGLIGFTNQPSISTKDGKRYDGAEFYYTRNKYPIAFISGGKTIKTLEKYYEESLTGVSCGEILTPPAGKENYEFAGWYDNPEGEGTEYSFEGKRMPANGITVYAKWVAPTYNIEIYQTVDASDAPNVIRKSLGEKLSEGDLQVTVPEGYIFRGWYLYENGQRTQAYNSDTEIHGNIKLVPYWTSNKAFSVTYSAGEGGSGTVSDPLSYAEGAQAELKSAAGLTPPTGKPYFQGWKSEADNRIYYPGDKYLIKTENVEFVAQWGEEKKTTLAYDPGTGNGVVTSVTVENNAEVNAKSVEELGFSKENFTFVGWSYTNAEGQPAVAKAGDKLYVDVNTNPGNTITAQWAKLSADGGEWPYDGSSHTVSNVKVDGDVADYTIAYVVDGSEYVSADAIAITNAGTKTVTVIARKAGYIELRKDVTLTVTPKAVTVTAENKSKVYGEKDPVLTAAVSGTIGDDTVDYSLSREAGENVGEYVITASGEAEQGNYTVTYKPGTLTITKKGTLTVTGTSYNNEYDAKVHGTAASVNVTEGTKVFYKVGEDGEWTEEVPTIKDVGSKEVTVKAENPNYETAEDRYTLTVTPKAVTVTAEDKSKVYGDAEPELTADVSGTIGRDTVDYSLSREAGENVGEYVITASGEAEQGNYTVTYKPGTLTITKKGTLTVTGTSYNNEYDAKVHGTAASVNVTEGTKVFYKVGEDGEWTEEVPTIKDVGSKEVTVKAENPNYETAEDRYTLTVTPKAVTVTAEDKSKVYGDAEPELTAAVSGTIGNDTVTYSLSREAGENVGEYAITASGDAEQGNYTVAYNPGTLTITKKGTLTVTGTSYNNEYDANVHGTAASVNVTEGTKVSYKVGEDGEWTEEVPTIKDVGSKEVTVKAENPNYETAEDRYTLTVTPKAVTVTADDKSKVYGETDPELTADVSGTIGNDTVDYSLSREAGENVGEYAITASGEAEQGNYTVTYNPGTLTITKKGTLTVTGTSYNNEYDANVHGTAASVNVTEGTKVSYKVGEDGEWTEEVPTIKDVGSKEVTVKAENPNYETAEDRYTLTVTPKAVTVTADDKSKVYGEADPELTAAVSGTIGNDTVTYSLSREAGENVGEYAITASGDAEQGNYTVAYNPGTLTITKKGTLTVTGTSYDNEYDANVHGTAASVNVTEGTKVSYKVGEDGEWTEEVPTIKDVGSKEVTVKAENPNYETAEDRYTLTVTPKAVTVTADDKSKVYGEADPELTAAVSGTIGNDTVTYSLSREAGENVGEYAITASGDAEQGNYTVAYNPGTLTITKKGTLTVTGTSYNNEYDANVHGTAASVNVTEGTKVSYKVGEDGEWTEEVPTIKDVGSKEVTVKAENPNYKAAEDTYTLTVTPKAVTVTAENKSKVYGEKDPALTAVVSGTIGDEKVAYSLSRAEGENVGNYAITASGEEKQGNYTVTYNPGTLTITKNGTLAVTGTSYNNEYDANVHGTAASVNVTEGTKVSYKVGEDGEWTEEVPTIKDVGSKEVTVKAENPNYKAAEDTYTLTVTPKAVTVTAENKSKVYGEKDPALTAAVSGTIGGDTVDYSLSREAGEAVGKYAITASGEEKQGNYTVTYIQGTLTITEQSIAPEDPSYKRVTVDSPSDHEYDGNEHKWKPTVKDGSGTELTAGTDYEVSYDAEDFVNVKTITVTIKGIGNYKGQVTRTYKITPKAVTVTAENKSKVYGETDPALTADVSGTIGNDTVDYSLSREAGENVGEYVITASGEAEQGNYTVAYKPGTLTITKKGTLTVTGTSYNNEYDANVHGTAASVNVTEGTKVSYKVGEDGEWTEEVPTIKDVGSKEVTVKAENPNYETAEDRYTLTVTPKAVTVTADDKSKVYGEADPALTAAVSGTIGDDTVDYSLSREAGEAVGNYAITASGEEKQGNYTVTYNPGTLTIIAKNIGDDKNAEVDSPVDVTYNGLEQKWEPTVKDKKTGEVLVKDRDYIVSYDGDVVNVTKPGIQVTITGIENYSGSVERSYKILPKEVIVITENGNKVYDTKPLTAPGTMTGLVNDETAGFVITGSQTLVGASANTYEITWKSEEEAVALSLGDELIPYTAKESNYVVNETIGTLTVTDGTEEEPIDPNLVVKKNDAQDDGYEYKLGETVSFTISATNIYAEAKDVTITELDGVIIEGSDAGAPNVLIKKDVAPGETVTATATYIITERDIAEGFFRNTVKVSFDGEKQYENEKTVEVEDAERKYTLTKTFGPSTHENGMFKAGETIHYTITVKNTGNQTLNQVEITDTLNAAGTISNIQGAAYKQDGKVTVFTIPTLEALGADVVITYDYVVQDADKGNKISNAAVGSEADPDKPDEKKPQDDTEVTVENPQLQVQKNVVSIVAADGTVKDPAGKADQNDIITYSVTVKNTGNVKLLGTKITDSLEGIQLAEGQSFEIGDLEVGAEKTVTYTYVVKATDLGKTILNIATATANVPENPEDAPKPENKDEKKVETEDPANCSIIVTKKLTNINGELLALKSAQFNVALFTDEAMTQRIGDVKTIAFGENQGTATVTFENLKRGIYYVAETDAEGKVVENGQYNDGSYIAVYQAGNKVEITENGTAAAFEFSNQFVILPGEYYIVKKINITKNVFTKDGEELDSDETFYAGIFKDAEYTQLADNVSQNIVPLALNGKASVSQTVEVTVPVGGEEVTLYIAEVNKDGVPVDQVEDFAYTSEVENAVVTLSETSEDVETVIDNTSTKDEPTITPEPTEPSKKPETPQEPDTTGTQKKGVKTGDDTPIGQFGFLLMCSVACVTLIIGKRKKEKRS